MGKKKWRRKYERLLERYRWLEACQSTPIDATKPTSGAGALTPFAGDWIPVDGWTAGRCTAGTGSGYQWQEETWQ